MTPDDEETPANVESLRSAAELRSKYAARRADNPQMDAHLAALGEVWPGLAPEVREAIVALVGARVPHAPHTTG